MKKELILSLSSLCVGIFCMSFAINKQKEDKKTKISTNKELAYYATEDSIGVVKQQKQIQSELDKINQELTALEEDITVAYENCVASYYHDKFNGRKTASGKVFNNKEYTAAHKTLPFGTKVRVTNLKNDEEVIVTITDRGPFVKGKTLDLSKKAFMEITHNNGAGHLDVKVEILPEDYINIQESLNNEKEALSYVRDSLKSKILDI